MLRRDVMSLCVFFLVFSLAGMASATYTVTSMGTYSGTATNLPRNYLAMGQNANGGDTVVGLLSGGLSMYYWQGADAQESSGTKLTNITPAGGSGIFQAVSPNGSLAGGRGGSGGWKAVSYPIPGTTGSGTVLSSYVTYPDNSVVTGINNAGVMAVMDYNSTLTNYESGYLLPNGSSYTYGTLPGSAGDSSTYFGAIGMSGNGNIVGSSSNTGDYVHLWTPIKSGGVITGYNSPTLLGNTGGFAKAVNDAGQAVGQGYFNGAMSPNNAPALFVGNHSYPINTGSNLDAGAAIGINSKGYVVGWDNWEGLYGTNGLTGHGFLWVPTSPNATTGTMQDMNTVFASVLTGTWANYVITDGLAINDNGDVLVRMSLNGTGGNNTGTIALISTPWPATHNPGDANGDGKADVNDLGIVLTNYGNSNMSWAQGEFTGDGTVDVGDLSVLLSAYGATYTASPGIKAVPEPATLTLLAAGLLGLLALTRRK